MIVRCSSCATANRLPAARLHERAKCGLCKEPLDTGTPLGVHGTGELDDLLRGAAVPVLVDFWAPWCGPCQVVAPQLELLAKSRRGKVIVAKVNTDELPDLGERHRIRSIPTMILFSGGREHRRVMGAMPADAIARGVGL